MTGGQTVTCEWPNEIPETESFRLKIVVKIAPSTTEGLAPNTVEVSGGDVEKASLIKNLHISGEATKFGVQDYEILPEDATGHPETQAGSHPFQLTTNFNLNQTYVTLSGRRRTFESPFGAQP